MIPPTQFYNTQGAIQENIPVVQIHVLQTREFKAGKVRSGANNYILISNPTKYFYKDLAPLFVNLKPRNNKVGQFHIDSVSIIKLFDDTIGFKRYAHKPNSRSKKSL